MNELPEQILQEESKKENFFKRIWRWTTKDKGRISALVFILLFIVIIIVLAALGTNLGEQLQKILDFFESRYTLVGIYIGVFIISIFGNFTVIFPVPYTFAIVTVAARDSVGFLEVIIVGLCAGLGAAVGETTAWLFGKASKNVIEEGMEKQVSQAQKWIDRGLAPLIIFIFAATPLPDDAVLVFIGLLSYSLWKTLLWCFLGKIVLTSSISLVTKLFTEFEIGEKILWLFGLSTEGGEISASDPNPLSSALVWLSSIILIGVVLFIDWGVIWNRIRSVNYKGRLLKFLNISNNPQFQKLEKSERKKDKKLLREAYYWECKIIEETNRSDDEEQAEFDYFGLLSIDYLKDNSLIIKPKLVWYNDHSSNECQDDIIQSYKITNFRIPTNESKLTEENKIQSNKFICQLSIKHKKFKKPFQFSYLIQKSSQYNLICIGEKEAEAINLVKKYSRDIILMKLANFLENEIETDYEITKIIIAKNQYFKNIIPNYLKKEFNITTEST
ncbi:MAG: VTT domain-containing protein [Asgard group archaeon]|nr:VTT domain-containing protein [Asgard group archaeon]